MQIRAQFNILAQKLNLNTQSDWYNLRRDVFCKHGGRSLLRSQPSLLVALETVYPEFNWYPRLPKSAPDGFWKDTKNCRMYLDWLSAELGITTSQQLYSLSVKDLESNNGTPLLLRNKNSLCKIFTSTYSEFEWLNWKFQHSSVGDCFWDAKQNQRQFLDWASEELCLESMEDWHYVSNEEIAELGGRGLLCKYGDSLIRTLSAVYSEHEWNTCKFAMVSQRYWTNPLNHRKYFNWLAAELNIQKSEDWYGVRFCDIVEKGGEKLISDYYGGSLLKAPTAIYPEINWLAWKFPAVPRGFWKDKDNQRLFFDWLATELNLQEKDDWYTVTSADVEAGGGGRLLSEHYNGSLVEAPRSIYPLCNWFDWLFESSQNRGSPSESKHEKEYFEWLLAEDLNIQNVEDWLTVSHCDIEQRHGSRVQQQFDSEGAQGFWDDSENGKEYLNTQSNESTNNSVRTQRRFLDWFADEKNIERQEQVDSSAKQCTDLIQWYKVKKKDIAYKGGRGLLATNCHLIQLLQNVYPEYTWLFKNQTKDHIKEVIYACEKRFNIHNYTEWKLISVTQLRLLGLVPRNTTASDLLQMLTIVYPQLSYEKPRYLVGTGSDRPDKRQGYLVKVVKDIGFQRKHTP